VTRAVVVTRDEPRDGPLSERLRARGLEVLWWPVVRIGPPADPSPLEDALAAVATFDWIVFASRHAVSAVTERLPAAPAGVRIAAVGAGTAQALGEVGWPPSVPHEPHAEALVTALAPRLRKGSRVLFPASSRALPTIGEGLRALGAEVRQVEAYRTEAAPLDLPACRAAIDRRAVGAVTFTSPSCVEELEQALGREHFLRLLAPGAGDRERAAFAVALGPTTASALETHGIEPIVARQATLESLAATTHQLLNTR
jgi:uroporphyrinogen-III synthase